MSSFFPPSQPCFRQGRYDLEAAQLPIGGPGLGLKATEIQLKALPRGRSWNGISMLQKPKKDALHIVQPAKIWISWDGDEWL